ncbi:MAG: bifunctional phosphoglucose/phosphomannose isomerase [Candidatus Liptonbacteria bacterium]|nr:bifunctional phosphoglucose/phosphomannose isomerase [Candidatus Liptonbacteria bacterium]
MEDALKKFPEQFAYEPRIEHEENLRRSKRVIVAGMGGSHLASGIVNAWKPSLGIRVHRDYGLPPIPDEELKDFLLVAISYSGNTEETLDAFEAARAKGLARAAISLGGKLLERARAEGVPHVTVPDAGLVPRVALGFMTKALLAVMGESGGQKELETLPKLLRADDLETAGRTLADTLKGRVPVIYASNRNEAVAYNWKIKFNETGKIPAFMNVIPEANHNEMTGFDAVPSTEALSKNFSFLFMTDDEDHPRVQKRFRILKEMYEARKLPVTVLELAGRNRFHKIFASLLAADWTAYGLAQHYGTEPVAVPMVEEFKKRMLE